MKTIESDIYYIEDNESWEEFLERIRKEAEESKDKRKEKEEE